MALDKKSDGVERGDSLSTLARKAVSSSIKSILSSEDGLKALVASIVPKEVGQTVLRELAIMRSEAVKAFGRELTRFLQSIDIASEIQKVLAGLSFDIHIKVDINTRQEDSEKRQEKPKKKH